MKMQAATFAVQSKEAPVSVGDQFSRGGVDFTVSEVNISSWTANPPWWQIKCRAWDNA